MMRLFVAIDLPDTVKDRLTALQTDIPTARWVNRNQMHLTLFFIGDTDQIGTIKTALADVQTKAFPLTLAGVGRFPKRRREPPRVLWVGVNAEPALQDLHRQVTAALVSVGFKPEARPFSAHITLARLKTRDPLDQVDQFLDDHRALQIPPFSVSEFVLFSSILSPQGARYRREAVFSLTTP